MPTSSADSNSRPEQLLVISGLTAGYGGSAVISDVDLVVGSKEVVTMIGPNGAGKSTMLGAVMGRVKIMGGSITLRGTPITRMRAHELSRLGIGYVPQTRDIFETLTVRENLEMGGYSLSSSLIPAAMDKVFSIFPDLVTHLSKRAGKLSGGERKMLAIGRVLMPEPSVLILDEPTANLSPKLARMVLREQVPRLAESGVAVLLVEQKALEALEISDWGYLLVAGRVQLAGQANDLATRPGLREMFLGQVVAGHVDETEPASEGRQSGN
jgi:ABC-type branched-subunit amino acid transport system ATPase component